MGADDAMPSVVTGLVLLLLLSTFSGLTMAQSSDGVNTTETDDTGNGSARFQQTGSSTDPAAANTGASSSIAGTVLAVLLGRPQLVLGILTGFLVMGGAIYLQTDQSGTPQSRSTADTLLQGHRQHRLESELADVTREVRHRTGDAAHLTTDDTQLAFRLLRKARRALRNGDYDAARLQIDRIYALYRQSKHGTAR